MRFDRDQTGLLPTALTLPQAMATALKDYSVMIVVMGALPHMNMVLDLASVPSFWNLVAQECLRATLLLAVQNQARVFQGNPPIQTENRQVT